MTTTSDTGVPLLASQQEQPEITHNEAIEMLAALAKGVISVGALSTPPGSPTAGDAYVIGASPTGAWVGRANAVTWYTTSGWRFFPDRDSSGTIIAMGSRQEGIRVWDNANNTEKAWNGSAWQTDGAGGLPTSGGTGSVVSLAAEPVEVFETTANTLAFDYDDGEWQEWTATQAGTTLSVVTANLPAGGMIRMVLYDCDTYAPTIASFTPVLNGDTITFDAVTVVFAEKLGDGTVRYIAGGTYGS